MIRVEEPAESATTRVGSSSPMVERGTQLRVAVLSEHPLMRAGLCRLLSNDGVRVSIVEGPLRVGRGGSHDVVVYDATDEGGDSMDALAVLIAVGVPVVALTPHRMPHLAEIVLALGVAETVRTDIDAVGLIEALTRAATGQKIAVEAHHRGRRDAARADTRLTEREMSILELIGAGVPNQEIAERLYLSINTVKAYIRTAYRKIGVSRRVQAVLWAAQHDLIPVSPELNPARAS